MEIDGESYRELVDGKFARGGEGKLDHKNLSRGKEKATGNWSLETLYGLKRQGFEKLRRNKKRERQRQR